MGSLRYGRPAQELKIEDRTLAHLKIVIIDKLRRNESFPFSFVYDDGPDGALNTIWIHPNVPLQFRFDGSRRPTINVVWLEELIILANSVSGLRIVPEPGTPGESLT